MSRDYDDSDPVFGRPDNPRADSIFGQNAYRSSTLYSVRDKLAEHPTYRRLRSLFGPAPYPHICRSHHDTPVELGPAPSPSDLPSKRGGTQAIGLDVRDKSAPNSADLWRAQRVHWLPDLVVRPGGEFDLPPDFPPERLVVRIQADPGLDELREGLLDPRWNNAAAASSLQELSDRLTLLFARLYRELKGRLEHLDAGMPKLPRDAKRDALRHGRRLLASAFLLDHLGDSLFARQRQHRLAVPAAADFDWRQAPSS